MKKFLILTVAALTLIGSSVWAFMPDEFAGYSATKTGDALIHTGTGFFYGFACLTDGTNSVTFDLYDNTEASGTKIAPSLICTTSSSNRVCVFGSDVPIVFNTGLYVDVTSSDTTPDYTIYYRGK